MTNVELNWEDPFPSFMRHCKKSQNYPVPTSTWCVWVLALHFLVTDGSQNWQARKDETRTTQTTGQDALISRGTK